MKVMLNLVNILKTKPMLGMSRGSFGTTSNLASKYKDESGGGHIRDAGGAFGKMEAAKEGQYFYNVQKQQLKELQSHMSDEIEFHEEQIKRHQEAIDKAKNKLDTLKDSK